MSDEPEVEGRRDRRKREVRERILTAAEALFKEKGFDGVSMDEIAAVADVARKTLFNHLQSKEAAVVALVERLIYHNRDVWTESSTPVHGDPRDVVAPRVDDRLRRFDQNRWLLELAADHTQYYNTAHAFPHHIFEENFAKRVERIRQTQAAGGIRADISAESISWYYEALRNLTTQRWLKERGSSFEDLKAGFEEFVKLLNDGLQPRNE